MEDNDIKIFEGKSKHDTVDSVALIAEMNTQRSNGNTAKAKKLGEYLANRFLDTEKLAADLKSAVGELNYPKNIIFQIKILVFFTSEYSINRLMPNNLLKTTATNTIYDNIANNAGDFYKEFSDGIEYSFYYLAVKEPDDILAVGKAFAMACQKKDNKEFIELGEKLFVSTIKEMEAIIESYDFVK